MNVKKQIDNLVILSRDNLRYNRHARLAAAIYYKNKLISYGFNSIKSHPLQNLYQTNEYSIYLHAEIDAIKNALRVIDEKDLAKCSILIARSKQVNSKVVYGLAKPCTGCTNAIRDYNIKNTYYTLNIFGYSKL